MTRSITLATDVAADPAAVFDVLSTTEGQRAFWTTDCDVTSDHARFGFAEAPVDLEVTVAAEPGKLVRMHVTSGFPFWTGSTWEWQINTHEAGAMVLFRHYGFGEGYPEMDLGHTAQTWAMIMDRLARYLASGHPHPFFPGRPS